MYACTSTSLQGFIQQLAVSYIAHGYWFYVTGFVPEGKDPAAIDRKLIDRYDIGISKWAKARRKQNGAANLQYIRHGRFFVLLATHGRHAFFEHEASVIRDARHVSIKYGGYSVSFRGGHAHVRIEQGEYNRLKAYLLALAKHRREESLVEVFARISFEPYAPIRRQLLNLLRAVNRSRRESGFSQIPTDVIRFRRRILRPFADERLPAESSPRTRTCGEPSGSRRPVSDSHESYDDWCPLLVSL